MNDIVTRARSAATRQRARCSTSSSTISDRALANPIAILDPDDVVLGGGLSNVDELYDRGARRRRTAT